MRSAANAFFGGQKSFQVQAYPFQMTAQNMAKHRNNPNIAFWKMLKKGNDHFEVTRLEPKVNVCEKRYVFDAEAPGGSRAVVQPGGQVPGLRSARRDRQRGARQGAQGRDPVRRAQPPQHPDRADQDQRRRRHASGVRRSGEEEPDRRRAAGNTFLVTTAPGTIPPTVRPPRIPELATRRSSRRRAGAPVREASPPGMAIAETQSQSAGTWERQQRACSAACSRPE